MRLMRAVFGLVLALALFAVPTFAQTVDTNGDHHDTNSKTKKAVKKAADKTKGTADAAEDKTEAGAKKAGHKTKEAASETKDKMTGEKLDINTASREDLMKLDGVGDVYSQKIIDARPYRAKSDLLSKGIVPKATYEKIKDKIIAHHVAGTTKAKKSAAVPADKK